jgi:hypothetical protein
VSHGQETGGKKFQNAEPSFASPVPYNFIRSFGLTSLHRGYRENPFHHDVDLLQLPQSSGAELDSKALYLLELGTAPHRFSKFLTQDPVLF